MHLLLPIILSAAVSASPLVHRLFERAAPGSSSSANFSTKAPAFVASTWFAGWHANSGFPVSDVSWDKYTHIKYAFATTTPDVNTIAISQEDQTVIPQFISAAHSNGVPTSIAVGGWSGSQYFSTAVATAQNRTAFVNTLSTFVNKWGFDGIDFDWEYPNHQGIGCNTISPMDTQNFLLLLKELRSTPATSKLILTAATAITPFVDATGSPSSDVSAFATVLDFIEIMNYDIWGSFSTSVGPNSPLDDSCAPGADQQGSAKKAVAAWTKAGFPESKIVLGVAGYGHSFSVANTDAVHNGALTSFPPFNKANQPHGDVWDGAAGPDLCGVQQLAGGIFNFGGLIQTGFLTTTGQPASGITYRFDNCSQTAYVYDATKQVEVSFDDVPSFTAKGAYIKSTSLRGFSMWEAGSDSKDILLDAILGSSGAPTC